MLKLLFRGVNSPENTLLSLQSSVPNSSSASRLVCSLAFSFWWPRATDHHHNMASIMDRSPRKVKQMLASLIHSPEATANDEADTSGQVHYFSIFLY